MRPALSVFVTVGWINECGSFWTPMSATLNWPMLLMLVIALRIEFGISRLARDLFDAQASFSEPLSLFWLIAFDMLSGIESISEYLLPKPVAVVSWNSARKIRSWSPSLAKTLMAATTLLLRMVSIIDKMALMTFIGLPPILDSDCPMMMKPLMMLRATTTR